MGSGVFQGLPLSLSGVARILEMMDWGDADEFISRGSIGGDVPQADDDYFILIAPQNIVGYAVLPYIQEMEASAGDRPMIMINPKLDDVQSAGNVMSIRGRGDRREYVSKWETAYHFRLLYKKPFFFPIFGALRFAGGKWELYKRFGKMESEEYRLMRTYAEASLMLGRSPRDPGEERVKRTIAKRALARASVSSYTRASFTCLIASWASRRRRALLLSRRLILAWRRIFFLGPSGMPSFSRSLSVMDRRATASISSLAKTPTYFPKPRPRRISPTALAPLAPATARLGRAWMPAYPPLRASCGDRLPTRPRERRARRDHRRAA